MWENILKRLNTAYKTQSDSTLEKKQRRLKDIESMPESRMKSKLKELQEEGIIEDIETPLSKEDIFKKKQAMEIIQDPEYKKEKQNIMKFKLKLKK